MWRQWTVEIIMSNLFLVTVIISYGDNHECWNKQRVSPKPLCIVESEINLFRTGSGIKRIEYFNSSLTKLLPPMLESIANLILIVPRATSRCILLATAHEMMISREMILDLHFCCHPCKFWHRPTKKWKNMMPKGFMMEFVVQERSSDSTRINLISAGPVAI